jgi:hypothetical protein
MKEINRRKEKNLSHRSQLLKFKEKQKKEKTWTLKIQLFSVFSRGQVG